MRKSAKSRAEEQFARIRVQQDDKKSQKDREKAETARTAQISRLRGLRLAKEAADKEAAAAAPAPAPRKRKPAAVAPDA